jgi:hypothetical protein
MSETTTPAVEISPETERQSFGSCLNIYIDSLEQEDDDNGIPVYRFRTGVTKASLQEQMKKTTNSMNTTLPKLKKFLHYGGTVFEYNGKEMLGVGEGSLQETLNLAVTNFIQYCDEEMKKPASERAFKVKKVGGRFPDFSGQRASGIKNPTQYNSVFSKLQGLSTPKTTTTKKA